MNIYVCIKQVPDTETKIKISGDKIDLNGVKWVMNPYDEIAVEEALQFKAKNPEATVTAICLGPKQRVTEALRTALAMGADQAVSIDAPDTLDSFMTAKSLANAITKLGEPKLIYTGKVAIDDNQSSVSQLTASFLNIPHASVVSKADYSDSSVTVEREIEGGSKEVMELNYPALVGVTKGLNTPRYASLPGIMKAKKKPVTEMSVAELDVNPDDVMVEYSDYKLPPERPSVTMIEGDVEAQVAELVKKLREEAKVI